MDADSSESSESELTGASGNPGAAPAAAELSLEDFIEIFVPEDRERRQPLQEGRRLAHYTTAEAAFKIIAGKEVWLRNALLMNDFSEIQYGLDCLIQAWNSEAGKALQDFLDRITPGLKDKIASTFDSHTHGLKVATFMISLSEHYDDEDELGRLSMWRAYGGRNGVALVLNPKVFTGDTQELKAFSAPVRYETVSQFQDAFGAFVERLLGNEERLKLLDRDALVSAFFLRFRLYVLCTKHPGFHEEREWRVFHSPLIEGGSKWLRKEICVIGGVPQEVVKLSLESDLASGVDGLSPAELIDRVIIGPSAQPLAMYHAFFDALADVGIEKPNERLWMSEIPLRH